MTSDDGHTDPLLAARALVLHDLEATSAAGPDSVSALEDAVSNRRWWVSQWREGTQYVAGLVAQDVQDALLATHGRWPLCSSCDGDSPPHALYIHPELGGPDPAWVCEESGRPIAALGHLDRAVSR